jgi:hypothetical protein
MRNDETKRSMLDELKEAVRQLLRKKEKPPEADPYAYVGAPLRHGPKGRSGAAAAEIEDDSFRSFPPHQQR